MTDPFGFDPSLFRDSPLFRELARVMAWRGGPVNWDLAAQTALAVRSGETDDGPLAHEHQALVEAVPVAELWLDQVTTLPRVDGQVFALSRREWVRRSATAEGFGPYVEPLAEGMSASFGQALGAEMSQVGPVGEMLRPLGAVLFGLRMGTVIGHLAGDLLAGYDLGLPTLSPTIVATVGGTARRFAEDYDFDEVEFRFWLVLREAAYRRQFTTVTWLREAVVDLIRAFAAAADFSPERLLEQFGGMGLDPTRLTDPQALQEALQAGEGIAVEPTPGQREALERLQTIVAFTSSWVTVVVRQAAGDRLPNLVRIEEAMRRRRAEQGPGERFLEDLFGLNLRPADLRVGEAFCDTVVAARGQEGLDRVWRSRAHLPTASELAEPSRWLVRMAALELEDGQAGQPG